MSDEIKGRIWESDAVLRAGRLASLEIVLEDSTVSRRHAEIRHQSPAGWMIRDLDSTNGTFVSGLKLIGERPLRLKDVVQFGKVALVVEKLEVGAQMPDQTTAVIDQLLVEAAANNSWEDAQHNLVYDRNHKLRPGEQLHALVQAAGHLIRIEKEDELLDSILHDAVNVLDAQRGAIVLWDEREAALKLKRVATGLGDGAPGRFHYSQKIAQMCFTSGQSHLCSVVKENPELATQSIADGEMASVICALLRTTKGPLGVLHLDRTPWQKPFTQDDLHLADALAASVSVGIYAAQLYRKEREMARNTIRALAQLVESKDKYTGNHIQRVTNYAVMLAKQFGLSQDKLEIIELGAILHDVGKVNVPDAILNKTGQLTPEETAIMRSHVEAGVKVLEVVPELKRIIPLVRHHHERWDGTGYPQGLQREQIPIEARIVAVVDAFDAMTTHRPHCPARPAEVAFAELQRMAGAQFDPNCVAAFLAIKDKVLEVMEDENQTAIVKRTDVHRDEPRRSQSLLNTVANGDAARQPAKSSPTIPTDSGSFNPGSSEFFPVHS